MIFRNFHVLRLEAQAIAEVIPSVLEDSEVMGAFYALDFQIQKLQELFKFNKMNCVSSYRIISRHLWFRLFQNVRSLSCIHHFNKTQAFKTNCKNAILGRLYIPVVQSVRTE